MGLASTTAFGSTSEGWGAKVAPEVLARVETGATAETLVVFKQQADLSDTVHLSTKEARGRFVFETLTGLAERTQSTVIEQLEAVGARYQSFWIANMIWVEADYDLVRQLAQQSSVSYLAANPRVRLHQPETSTDTPHLGIPEAVEWNIERIGAPLFWAAGHTGQGIVIGGQDTGYDWDHPALVDQYRGWDGAQADHDYNWHDAIHSGGGICGSDSPEPCDDQNHGTHTMGTMIGDDGLGNQIGVAPGARWIGCRNMDEGSGTPASYAECFQFFVAPTRVDGSDPDPARAPHVINNSWVCPPEEGCDPAEVLQTVVENTRAAGIVVVASAGNDGPGCSTIDYPPAIHEAALTVGATTSADQIWSSSSRGAVTVDGSLRLKPNVAAPGAGIRSSLNGGGYSGPWSGTSMAGPHVAGQVALLISAVPGLAGHVETLETCVEATAIPSTSAQQCSGIPGDQIPNNVFGWGRARLSLPLPVECSTSFIFADGFDTGTAEGWK